MASSDQARINLRVIHGALVVSVLLVVGVLFLLGRVAPGAVVDLGVPLRTVGFVAGVGAVLAFVVLRGRIQPAEADDAAAAGRTFVAAVVLWALLEGLATLGAVFWYLTGELVLLATPTGVGLVLLIAARPGSLLES